MSKKLTILFTPIASLSHINACHGIAQALRDRNHRVVFAIDQTWNGKLKEYGFEEEIYSLPRKNDSIDFWPEFMRINGPLLKLSSFEKMNELVVKTYKEEFESQKL